MGISDIFRKLLGRPPAAPLREVHDGVFGFLVVEAGDYAGQRFELGYVTTIGAIEGNTIVLREIGVGKRHVGIMVEDGEAHIADLASPCGTMVNDAKITRQRLRHLDRIRVGEARLRFYAIPGRVRDVEPWPESMMPELAVPRGATRGAQCDPCGSKTCAVKHLPKA